MILLKKALRITQNDLLNLCSEIRFKICILLIFLFMNIILEETNHFVFSVGYNISPWIITFIINQRFMRIILYCLYLLLVCETPYSNMNQLFLLIRSGKLCFFIGKIFYIFLLSILYALILCISSILCIIHHIEFTFEWGKVLGTLALTDASSTFNHSIKLSSNFILNYSPISIFLLTFLLSSISFFVIGMTIYCFNIVTNNCLIGNIIIAIFILFDFLLETDIVYQKLIYFSPLTWTNTTLLDLNKNTTIYPSLFYVLCGYIILILLCISIILMYSKKYNFEWQDN